LLIVGVDVINRGLRECSQYLLHAADTDSLFRFMLQEMHEIVAF